MSLEAHAGLPSPPPTASLRFLHYRANRYDEPPDLTPSPRDIISASPASHCCNDPSHTIMGWLSQKSVNSSNPTSPGATNSAAPPRNSEDRR
jgi:hypothetical protein